MMGRKMAALQMEIDVYRSGRFGFGRPSTVPCRGAVHAFLRTCILTYMHSYVHAFLHGMAFCIAYTAETYACPNARSQSSDGFNWQQARIPYLDSAGSKSGSQTCAQSAMGLDSI